MKNHTRKSKASGSTRWKVERLITLGWAPGKRLGHWRGKSGKRAMIASKSESGNF